MSEICTIVLIVDDGIDPLNSYARTCMRLTMEHVITAVDQMSAVLRTARKRQGLTQQTVADLANVSCSFLSDLKTASQQLNSTRCCRSCWSWAWSCAWKRAVGESREMPELPPLIVYFEDRVVGRLTPNPDGRLEVEYDAAWLSAADTFDVSLSFGRDVGRFSISYWAMRMDMPRTCPSSTAIAGPAWPRSMIWCAPGYILGCPANWRWRLGPGVIRGRCADLIGRKWRLPWGSNPA